MLETKGDSFAGKTVVSGSGNVAQYATEKSNSIRW
jgi:glutamate dehydrogenase/leucine dehydrogenase